MITYIAVLVAAFTVGWFVLPALGRRLRRQTIEPPDTRILVGVSGVALGNIDPERMRGLINQATVDGLSELLPRLQDTTEIHVEPGSFYLGMLVSGLAHTGAPTEVIPKILSDDETLPDLIAQLRREVA